MYTIGSLADLISGSDTPNKPKVELKEIKSTPFKTKKSPKDFLKKGSQKKENSSEDVTLSKPILKTSSEEKTPSRKRKGIPENSGSEKKKKFNMTNENMSQNKNESNTRSRKKPMSQTKENVLRRLSEKNSKKGKKTFDDPKRNCTIFVGNVPLETKENALKGYFMKYGKISSIRFRNVARADLKVSKKVAFINKEFNPNAKSINCFIVFDNEDSAKRALVENGSVFEGNHIRVDLLEKSDNHDLKKGIFVGNLPFSASEEDLWNTFSFCGKIDYVRLVRDNQTGIGKGYGYVNFESSDAVELALHADDILIADRKPRIQRLTHAGSKKRNEKGGKKRKIPRTPKEKFNKVNIKSQDDGDDKNVDETEDDTWLESKNKKMISTKDYQGIKFTTQKKKIKQSKALLKKKKLIKFLNPAEK